VVVYGKEKIEKVIAEIENPVLVYSPNVELKVFIVNLFVKHMIVGQDGNVTFDVSNVEVVKQLLSKMTNIDLGLEEDNKENEAMIAGIVADPSDLLLTVNDIIGDVSKSVMERWTSNMGKLQSMPEKDRIAYIKEVERQSIEAKKITEVPVVSEKELKKIALKKQLEDLDKEDEVEIINEIETVE